MTNYEIVKAEPQQLHLQVKYSKTDCPDYWMNLRHQDFSEEGMHAAAVENASQAKAFWDSIAGLPESVSPANSKGTAKDRIYTDAPTFDSVTQEATYTWVESDDALTQTWNVVDKSDDAIAESIRKQRTALLRDTDYYALTDVAMSTAMTSYRQALRDVPQQSGFPRSVDWPTEP